MTSFEKALKYSIFFGLISLLFTSFIVSNWLFFPYITGKAYFFRVVVEIIFFLWIILAAMNKDYRPKKGIVLYSIIAFLISIFISNLFGENVVASFWSNFERMEGFVMLAHLFGLFLVAASTLREENDWKILFNISIFASLILSIISVRQLLSDEGTKRIDSTLGNPIYLAIYTLFHIFIALLYLSKNIFITGISLIKKNVLLSFYFVTILLNFFVLLKTGTRGAILGFVGGLLLSVLLILLTNLNNKKIRNISAIVFVTAIISIGLFIFFRDTDFIQSNRTLRRVANISIHEGTAEARLINWRIAWQGFKEKPILGWGQSNYNLVFDKYYLPEMHGNESWFDRAHNIIFDWLIVGGIFGLTFYLLILSSALYLIWKNKINTNKLDKSVLTGLFAAYFFHNLFVFDQVISYTLFFFVLAHIHSQNSTEIKTLSRQINLLYRDYVVAIFIGIIPIVIYFVNFQSYFASMDLNDATKIIKEIRSPDGTISYTYFYEQDGLNKNLELFERAISRNTFANPEIRQQMLVSYADVIFNIQDENSNEIKQKFITKIISELEKQIAEFKDDSRFTYLLGSFYSLIKDENNSEKWLLETIKLSPKKQAARIPLVRAYLQFGQKEKALELASETYYLDKNKDDIWFEYAKIVSMMDKVLFAKIIDEALIKNDTEKVIRLFEYFINLKPDNIQGYVSFSALHHKIGNKEEAVGVLDNAISKFPQHKNELLKLKKGIEDDTI
jgi:O-antigen ligase